MILLIKNGEKHENKILCKRKENWNFCMPIVCQVLNLKYDKYSFQVSTYWIWGIAIKIMSIFTKDSLYWYLVFLIKTAIWESSFNWCTLFQCAFLHLKLGMKYLIKMHHGASSDQNPEVGRWQYILNTSNREETGRWGGQHKRIKVCCAYLLTPHDEWDHYILQACTNKNKVFLKKTKHTWHSQARYQWESEGYILQQTIEHPLMENMWGSI